MTHPSPVTMVRAHLPAVAGPFLGEAAEVDRLRCIAAGITLERARLAPLLRNLAIDTRGGDVLADIARSLG